MPANGNVIVFNKTFENMILKKLIVSFPEHEEKLQSIIDRIIDLQVLFKQFHYYHPSQKGSASLKAVFPNFSDKKYTDLEIQNGKDAFTAFYEKYYLGKKGISREALLEYCKLDTLAMVEILEGI